MGGLPWARYSVDELYQQAKAGDRPYPEDLRSIFWAAPHDPDEDFHWARQISSWTLAQLHFAPALASLGVPATASGPEAAGPEEQGPESDPPGGLKRP